MHMCVQVPLCTWRPDEDIRCPALPLSYSLEIEALSEPGPRLAAGRPCLLSLQPWVTGVHRSQPALSECKESNTDPHDYAASILTHGPPGSGK